MGRLHTVYLIRHAIAERAGPDVDRDADRPLTSAGIERWTREVRGLREMDASIDHVLTSPYLRTRQTADLLASGLKPAPDLADCAGLRPGGRIEDVMNDLRAVFHAGATAVALVGHEPSIGRIAGRLLGATHPIPFKKGAVCRIDFDGTVGAGAGWLVWLLPPRALRALGA
ncbi:MAG: phosphohistidine phosphatase SixA [Acidobacteriota bacterium]